ncbi:DUF995 domain-containing protein [Pararhizobium sp. YC-54]|uniref:DUF995 domain-containing protein n=1 Tax=Pararhizobium sp. YC-54 TaxID=2986920 RepID=UPI0021F7A4E9|nr:DUF995 domain-containing protein [Pararhizobium sp. YC-54]MCV9999717.1 DUF995 domain-containing protein [Pararhizobium sp. YC-54]
MTKIASVGAIALPVGGMLIGTLLTPAHAQPNRLPKKPAPVTAHELRQIYSDKTWKWSAGGVRFIGKGRRLIAFSEKPGKATFAEGRWKIDNDGRLCPVAVWVTHEGSAPANTCFQHVRDRRTIYQRREPDGDWYIFKTYRPGPEDEYAKLVTEDTVSPNMDKLKKSLTVSASQGG